MNFWAHDQLFPIDNVEFVNSNNDLFRKIILEKAQKQIFVFPLAVNQRALWLIDQVNKPIISYNIAFACSIKNPLRTDILRQALEIIIESHIQLRTTFVSVAGAEVNVCQVVTDKILPYIEEIDAANLTPSELDELIHTKSRIPFDLENGPLFKTYIFPDNGSTTVMFSLHHIITDGWSLKILVNEIFEYYNELLNGFIPSYDPISYNYSDFVYDQKRLLANDEGAKKIAFWKNSLQDKITPLILPYDFSRPPRQTFNGKTYRFSILYDRWIKISTIARELKVPPVAIMYTLYELMLSKLSQQDQFIIGVTAKNRKKESEAGVFGYMVNMIPLNCSLKQGTRTSDFIQENQSSMLEALENVEIPFPEIIESISVKRDMSMPAVFQAVFNYMSRKTIGSLMDLRKHGTKEHVNFGSLEVSPYSVDDQEGQFDLTLEIRQDTNDLYCCFKYNPDLFKPETIKRFEEEYLNLLELFISDPHFIPEWLNASVVSSSKISEDEKKMIDIVNDTSAEYSVNETLPGLFDKSARQYPQNPAIIFEGGELSYYDLKVKSDKLAAVLRSYNIGTGYNVGVLQKRTPDIIICLLAILKTGASYVPLNLSDPEARILSIISSADIKFIITNSDHDLNLPDICHRLDIEILIDQSNNSLVTNIEAGPLSTDPAYIIFTSGTTGNPKGVQVNHKSAVNLIEWVNQTFGVSIHDKLIWTTNLSFDLSVYDVFGILAAGATVRIVSDEEKLDPGRLYDIILNDGITFWDSAPQSLIQLTSFFKRDRDPGLYDSLRLVFLSGDWIALSLPEQIKSVFPSAVVVSLGGATEATIWSNYYVVNEINPEWKSIPYGKPIQNAKYYILDEKMEICGIRTPGSLYIGGECLALGYYNDPVLTNSKFIQDPYNKDHKIYPQAITPNGWKMGTLNFWAGMMNR